MVAWRCVVVAAVAAVGCAPALQPQERAPPALPQRIVSLDYCADQFVLKLADRSQITAVSTDADREFSYMRAAVGEIPQVRGRTEDVLALGPDLVVRSYGGGPGAVGLLERAGVPVAQLGYAEDFDGVRDTIRAMALAVGHPARGDALVAEMDARLAAVAGPQAGLNALYVTPAGYTSGSGSLVDAMIRAAGLKNFEQRAGWHPIPLERLAREQPDVIAAGFYNQRTNQQDIWSASRHPLVRAQIEGRPVAALDGALVSCGGWYLVEAVERLGQTERSLEVAQ